MLTREDGATIRHAILKRLDKERGVLICDVVMDQHADCIRVGVLAQLDDKLVVRSVFDLPPSFYLIELHNQIDEIAEQYKAARHDFWGRGGFAQGSSLSVERTLAGTGRRGRWAKVGAGSEAVQ